MAKAFVAISKVENGNMYIPTDQANEMVIKNREVWLRGLGISSNDATRIYVTYDQSDYCRYRILTDDDKGKGMKDDNVDNLDAIVTTKPGQALFLPIADCVGTVFYDEEHSVLMLSHLGRHSLEQQGGIRSVEYLVKTYASNPAVLRVWLSPSPNKEVYPIFALNNKGMKEALFEQLAKAGIDFENIIDNPADTATNPEYYSHTAFLKGNKPEDGRFAMVAMMAEG